MGNSQRRNDMYVIIRSRRLVGENSLGGSRCW